MSYRRSLPINRYVCDVLIEMRACYKTRNFSALMGLIEEAQILVNRMEASLNDNNDLKYNREDHKLLLEEINDLEKKKKKLEKAEEV